MLEQASCKDLGDAVKQIVSIYHGSAHFAVMEANIQTKKISIFDGLSYDLTTWEHHVVNDRSLSLRVPTVQIEIADSDSDASSIGRLEEQEGS